MVINRKSTGRALSLPAGLAVGAGLSLVITIIMAIVLAKLIESEKLPWENIGYGIMILILISSFLGGVTAYSKIKRQRIVVCLLSGVLYLGVLLSITALFFGGQYESVGVTALLVLGGSGAAGLIGLREGRGGSRKKIKLNYR